MEREETEVRGDRKDMRKRKEKEIWTGERGDKGVVNGTFNTRHVGHTKSIVTPGRER